MLLCCFNGANVIRNQAPAFSPLQHPPEHAYLHVDDRRANPGSASPLPETCHIFHADAPQPLAAKVFLQLHQQLPLFLLAGRGKLRLTAQQILSRRVLKEQPREVLARCAQLPLLRGGDERLLFRLSLAPVTRFERLPEPLTVDKEMRVPRPTAFFECHFCSSSHFLFDALTLLLRSDEHTRESGTSYRAQL